MRHSILVLFGAAASLSACGQSGETPAANNAAANATAAAKPRPAYCFFKDHETKDWAAKADRSGNVIVSGKVYRSDPRYMGVLSPAKVEGTTAEIAPTIQQNDTGFASPDNWWEVSQTIEDSQAVTNVTVRCGERTLAELEVPRKK